ncbi:uncharacterized protein LOC107362165 [Tetranychus urticae]|uniref:uncharacterized protein LOC107362165 n=1 Tax=Tetranychus urticae TaxID=32264 RepID=UPI00077BC9E7|nr:uncharacterized protein LOC107362165 [Tetranychus urticae]
MFLLSIDHAWSHGRLIDPPGRSTAWRFGFSTPINYNDNQLFCGGFRVQYNLNSGKCGICGDPYNGLRLNELPNGRYARSLVITRKYKVGSVIKASVQLTANHRGYFIFKLCPATSKDREVSQDCLDSYPLQVINSSSPHRYYVSDRDSRIFNVTLKLPSNLTCQRCVLQWTYVTGNNWGRCEGSRLFRVGCGPQETFRACADVTIKGNLVNNNVTSTTKSPIINVLTSSKLKPKLKDLEPIVNQTTTTSSSV